jgi:hypothetical protein
MEEEKTRQAFMLSSLPAKPLHLYLAGKDFEELLKERAI